MEQADFAWDAESLSAFLENPGATVPGTIMPFGGLRNEEQRRVLIEYLMKQ